MPDILYNINDLFLLSDPEKKPTGRFIGTYSLWSDPEILKTDLEAVLGPDFNESMQWTSEVSRPLWSGFMKPTMFDDWCLTYASFCWKKSLHFYNNLEVYG